MSHIVGTVRVLNTPLVIGPGSGDDPPAGNVWAKNLPHTPLAPGGTKFVIIHFTNVSLPANNSLEVELGYDTDVFTSADGEEFWTRPVNVSQVGGGTSVPLRYRTNGANAGGATVDRYARGESLQSLDPNHDAITNCDPFLPGAWVEPDFPHIPGSSAPKYDPFWICPSVNPPHWQNVRCVGATDIRRTVARSVGMIVTVHEPNEIVPFEHVSTCSVTLIDSDLVVLAGHCLSNHPFELPSSSVTFDYEVACNGTVLPGYDATFFKVIRLVKYRYIKDDDVEPDYAIVQLRGTPPLTPIPVRNGFPLPEEQVFSVHHPNGAVKKVSPLATDIALVSEIGNRIEVNVDVAGGSSGAGLFDMMGRIVGVLSYGGACGQIYSSTYTMLSDPILIPDPPTERAVMLVIDRSGSMSQSAGGEHKIDAARSAADLFISMLREIGENEAGYVSFAGNASDPVDNGLFPVSGQAKIVMRELLKFITPNGRTSIGDGLAAARGQFPNAGGPPRAILVLTDGMENRPQSIADVTGLGGIEITAIGFGTESNLDGPKLTDLAQTHGGFYKRAGTGLELHKFFALAFGDIFEAGAVNDPDLHLQASVRQGPQVPFNVCGEEAITVVVAWDNANSPLLLEVRTPSGQLVDLTSAGIDMDSGSLWLFARIPLPHAGEREGSWQARVIRPGHSGSEFPPPTFAVNYFINVIARGGPRLRPIAQPRRLYTGDVLHPKVMLQYPDETVPPGGTVTLSLRRPAASVGTILARHGLGPPREVDGDTIPARQATLIAIEQSSGRPVTGYVEEDHTLSNNGPGAGTFRPAGVFGKRLEEVLVVEGNYTFHARARVGLDCTTTREVQWTYHVGVGIDPNSTTVVAEPVGTGPGGDRVRVTVTPKDRYGNHVGPGAGDDLTVTPAPGCTLVGDLSDLGDGRYVQELECDPDSGQVPGISVTQPDRDPVILTPPRHDRKLFRYTAKLICGAQADDCCACNFVGAGRYATAITILNSHNKEVSIVQSIVPTEFCGAVSGRWPNSAGTRARERTILKPNSATTIDCCSVHEILLGAPSAGPHQITLGIVTIESPVLLEVTAAYTVAALKGFSTSIEVETIEPREIRVQAPRPAPKEPSTSIVVPVRTQAPSRSQDTARPTKRPYEGDQQQHDRPDEGAY